MKSSFFVALPYLLVSGCVSSNEAVVDCETTISERIANPSRTLTVYVWDLDCFVEDIEQHVFEVGRYGVDPTYVGLENDYSDNAFLSFFGDRDAVFLQWDDDKTVTVRFSVEKTVSGDLYRTEVPMEYVQIRYLN